MATRRKQNIWPFTSRATAPGNVTPARGGIAARMPRASSSARRPATRATLYRGHQIIPDGDGFRVPSVDPDSLFDTLADAKRFLAHPLKRNAASYRGMSVAKLEQMRPFVAVGTVANDWLERDRARRELEKIDAALGNARKRERKTATANPQRRANITDRAKRYRAQSSVAGPKKCVICGSTGNARKDGGARLDVMHLTGNESDGERANLAYGCRSCNTALAHAFKRAGAGRPTNQYNPASDHVPTFEQYLWAVQNHTRKAHDEGGAVIHATPRHKRIEYARRIAGFKAERMRAADDERWNPGYKYGRQKKYRIVRPRGNSVVVLAQADSLDAIKRQMNRFQPPIRIEQLTLGDEHGMEEYFGQAPKRPRWVKVFERSISQYGDGYPVPNPGGPTFGETLPKRPDYVAQMDRVNEQIRKTKSPAKLLALFKRRDSISDKARALDKWNPAPDHYLVADGVSIPVSKQYTRDDAEAKAAELNAKRERAGKSRIYGVYVPDSKARIGYRANPASIFDFEDAEHAGRERGRELHVNVSADTIKREFDIWWKYNAEHYKLTDRAGNRRAYTTAFRAAMPGRPRRSNPADVAAANFEEFSGRPSTHTTEVVERVHSHRHVSAAGELRELQVLSVDGRAKVKLSGFGGALLTFNEKKNQLLVTGGDQTVDLAAFGIDPEKAHELETLGRVCSIDYFADKAHLGEEGGRAVYRHKFRTTNENGRHITVRVARYPDLIYRVRDEHLEFSGGSYEIRAEGIDL